MEKVSRLTHSLSYLSLSLSALVFLAGPTRLFEKIIPPSLSQFWTEKGVLCAVLALIAGAILLRAVSIVLSPSKKYSLTTESFPTPKRWQLYLQIAFSIFILTRVIAQINAPFNSDELFYSSELAQGNYEILNPLKSTAYHGLSNCLSLLAAKTFGYSEWVVRLPGIFFTILFLFVLNLFCFSFVSPLVAGLIFLNLACNQMAVWYFHSSRGYSPMLFFTLALFYLFFKAVYDKKPLTKKDYFLIPILFVSPLTTHLFGGIFAMLLWTTLVLWAALNFDRLSPRVKTEGRNLTLIGLGTMGAVGLTVLWIFFGTGSFQGMIGSASAYKTDNNLLALVFGATRAWWVRMVGLALTGAVITLLIKQKKVFVFIGRDFLTLFLILSSAFFFVMAYLLDAPLFARLFLPWLVPFLLWVGRLIEAQTPSVRRAFAGFAVVFFGVFPLMESSEIYENVGNMTRVRELVGVATAGRPKLPARCFEFSGDPDQIIFARSFYLGNESRQVLSEKSPGAECDTRIHLFFAKDLSSIKSFEYVAPSPVFLPIYHDEMGNRILVSARK